MKMNMAYRVCLVALVALLFAVPTTWAGEDAPPAITADLVYLRQEEKLAHDVYEALGEKWKLPMFQNIKAAETRHTQAVAALMKARNIPDPVAEMKVGQFVDAALQKLHDEMVKTGGNSLADALKIGAKIEEMDIADLDKFIAKTDAKDVKSVYEQLRCGSANHLRAFDRQLKQRGIDYKPQHLSPEAYQKVLEGKQGPCGQGQGRGRPK